MSGIKDLRHSIEGKKGTRQTLQNQMEELEKTHLYLEQELDHAREEQFCIQIVAQETQEQLEYQISELVSLALQSVFDNPYTLGVDFIIRRGQTEADLYFERGGNKFNPLYGCGIGNVDVGALGLRLSRWTLSRPKSRPTFLLDEPFKHIKGSKDNERALQMIKELSHRLKIQIIMVSDERVPRETILAFADKVFLSTQPDEVSRVEVLK